MWPWGHLAVAYLVYVVYTRLDPTRRQTAATLTALAVGSQFPDLIDKPLAWTVGVLPSGRSLAHSLFTLLFLAVVLHRVAAWYRRTDLSEAFTIGAFVHTLTDMSPTAVAGLLGGDLSQTKWLRFLVWPLRPPPPYANDTSFVEQFASLTVEPYVLFQFGLFGIAAVVWIAHGAPGLTSVTRRSKAVVAAFSD
ncbi:metal-dependent hydrolase [Haloarcula sp. CBA1130]|uniref:metal-dependent hydrolase n=1 Tax=unclassified Haloarcula TaxID=2624677 RepID=UPI0012484E2A|nr:MULTISPECIES: metal-dependent hydrolase [unclassified Haloarcula]KAA9397034.1 metal-dependent hydrolase [Haloarcula sp. CBA1129]KAA9402928.1 metal-dependent hydrolase [Haloarcula sp. CBA1130]